MLVFVLYLFCLLCSLEATETQHDVIPFLQEAEDSLNKFLSSRSPVDGEQTLSLAKTAASKFPTIWQTHYLLAASYHYQNKDEEALKAIRKASKTCKEWNVEVQMLLGRCLIYSAKMTEATRVLTEIVSRHPKHDEAWHRLGTVFFELGELQSAAQAFHIAGRLNNKAIEYMSSGHILDKLNNHKSALILLATALRHEPSSATPHFELSRVLESQKQPRAAERIMRRIVALEPSFDAYFRLANTLMAQQRFADSVQMYERAVQFDNTKAGAWHNMAFSNQVIENGTGAVIASLEAVKCDMRDHPATPDPMYIIGLANSVRRAGELDLARDVARSLRQPKEAISKHVINDHIRVRVEDLTSAVARVEKWKKSGFEPTLGSVSKKIMSQRNVSDILEQRRHESDAVNPKKNEIVARATMLYLIGRKAEHLSDLKDSLRCLVVYFLQSFPYPVLILHEGLTAEQMNSVREIYAAVTFYQLEFTFPSHVSPASIPLVAGGHADFGYRHMCRFYAGGVFRLDILKDFDWYWRVDSDSYILEPVEEDPFAVMTRVNSPYGYMALGREDEPLTIDLWNTTIDFVRNLDPPLSAANEDFPPSALARYMHGGEWDRTYYYTNFEIVNLKFFRESRYLQFFDAIDRTTGIYLHRWGDAPLRLLGVSLFAEEWHASLGKENGGKGKEKGGEVIHFGDISYQHKVFVTLNSEGEEE